ncbi:21502_t:CDS:10 [Rhizophagus irregularis]|nr:21502_t:CDS:10 [Rhizophagus irregularis]
MNCITIDNSPEDPSKGLTIFDSYTYRDGTILLQLAHFNEDESCIDPNLNLDIVFPNGAIKPLNVSSYQIPIYNYCMLDDVFINSIINEDTILITYFYGDNAATTIHMGMIIDWDGNWLQPSKPTEIKKIGSGFISISPLSIITSFQMFTSSDGGNGFTLVTKIQKSTDYYITDPIWEVHAIFLDKDADRISPPYLLYQTSVDWADLVLEFCRKTTDGGGKTVTSTPITITTRYRLSFLSSGSVTSVKKLSNFGNNPNRNIERFIPLYSGGFLIVYNADEFGRRSGFFLTQEGEYVGVWEGFNNDIYHYSYLEHNETMWGMIVQNAPYYWTITTDRLHDKDVVHIFDDGKELLRQTYPGRSKYTSTINDTIVNIKVLSSTFSNPEANYFITIDDGFVNSKQYNEAIMGINKKVWFINTSWNEPDSCLPSATILLRLNAEGTKYINGLSSDGFKIFYNDLMNELSEIIPVDRSRLSDTGKFQSDPFDSNQFTILQVEISQPTKLTKPCVKDIISNLDSLIRNKDFTLISHYPLTNLLDEDFGTTITPDGWNAKMKLSLIFFSGGAILIIVIFFIVRYRNPQILFWTLHSLYITHNKFSHFLYQVGPIGFNSILALYIILKEKYTNEKFSKWLMNNTKLVSMFTILSSADVAILNMISSRLANLRYFCAPISKEAEIMYLQRNSIIYDPIPIFSLISAGISIIFSLIGRTFDALYYKIPFSERQNIKHEEPPTNVIEINSNKSIEISEDQLRKDDDTIEIT